MNYRFYIAFFIIFGIGTSAVFLVSSGYYPVAIVNGHFIPAKSFAHDYSIASTYYKNLLKAGNASSSAQTSLTEDQIGQSVLSQLIENALIDGGVRKEVGGNLNKMIDEKVNQAIAFPDAEKAISAFYGITLEDFKKDILVPQAKRDILTGNLLLKGEKIDDWLQTAKKSSSVIVLSGRFYWDGENVGVR
ncbi:MAG: SurA N-terminal domain-containing protein [Candidatus Liptonbacteria bacterium]|nr:SurA N-terminal domain-containing protein [Candidatus Liptonbacteria bacterium]